MDVFWPTLLASVSGTLAGGGIAGYFANQPSRVARRERARKARRTWRDDFYQDQRKLRDAIVSKDEWWPNEAQLQRLGSDDDIGVLAQHLGGEKWATVSGARRRMLTLENWRAADLEKSAARSGGDKTDTELWKLYKVMELSRKALADRKMPFKPHPTLAEVETAIGHSIWVTDSNPEAVGGSDG